MGITMHNGKENQGKLQVTHEGTTIDKKTRIDMLNREYEIIAIKEGESINELFERFNIIIVGLDAIRIKKMVKFKERGKGSSSRKQKKDFNKVTCYKCKETGHFKSDCPKLKKEEKSKKGKKKELMASWEDLENDSDNDEESETKSQPCLMADHVEQVVSHNLDTEDLHLMIDHVSEKITCFLLDNQDLEQQITILKVENGFLKDKLREAEIAVELVCLASKRKGNMWFMDSGCSGHMTEKATFFIKLDEYDGGFVTFGDDGKGKIVAIGKFGKSFSSSINDVLLVDGLKHNLLSVSQYSSSINDVLLVDENDSDCEDVVNKEINEENPKSVQNEESVRPVLSHQDG
ncbi:uncharacterized protein LOC107484071 [Arachis duranensis]|uniref:Uncharacterized protein LOC107484071 n=1 Tax=Arachis duranensis TaxID=130453 RepID=A0A6P4D339_ARADU|nr:uncharacterized protein LOC107484071 [Arachis duranensis]